MLIKQQWFIEFFLEEPELINNTGTAYSMTRSIKSKNGKYWLVNQITTPIQYDSNGRMAKYLSSYRILKKYEGEPFETEIYTDSKYPDTQEKLRKRLNRIRANMLEGLGFTKTERWIIGHMANGVSSKGIMQMMEISRSTLDNHRSAIIQKAKDIFFKNDFKYSSDVVRYLHKQGII